MSARSSELLACLTEPLARAAGLTLLPAHASTIAYSAGAFLGIQLLSRAVSPLISRHYSALPRKTREAWDIKAVSIANCAVLLPLVVRAFRANRALAGDKAFGTHPELLRLSAIATGYFLWDTLVEVTRGDPSFIIHGFSTLCIFLFSFRPFVLYFVPVSLVYELSTPFLNIHWFLDKTNRTGGTLQLVNGLLLLSTFFGARLVYGTYASYDLVTTVWKARSQIPTWLAAVYLVGNPVLNLLNIFWFGKMIDAMRRRFTKKDGPGSSTEARAKNVADSTRG